jgi:hypothetical protein
MNGKMTEQKFRLAREAIEKKFELAREKLEGECATQTKIYDEARRLVAELQAVKAKCLCGAPYAGEGNGFCRAVRSEARTRLVKPAMIAAKFTQNDLTLAVKEEWARLRAKLFPTK